MINNYNFEIEKDFVYLETLLNNTNSLKKKFKNTSCYNINI